MKREREKNKMSYEEMLELDPEMANQEREKHESARIRERLLGKHQKGNQFSKHAAKNKENREALQEQYRYRSQLMAKQQVYIFIY